jgi:GNAT superfamily N-acetyltransferase
MLKNKITYRKATKSDASILAHIHAESWRTAYRGILSDAYLDKDLDDDRLKVWSQKMAQADSTTHIIIAFDNKNPIGFICIIDEFDAQYGALIDNLHVLPGWKGQGIGAILMQKSVKWVSQNSSQNCYYLWVYEANTAAIAFYEKIGGICVEKQMYDNPGGGEAMVRRYVWKVEDN